MKAHEVWSEDRGRKMRGENGVVGTGSQGQGSLGSWRILNLNPIFQFIVKLCL